MTELNWRSLCLFAFVAAVPMGLAAADKPFWFQAVAILVVGSLAQLGAYLGVFRRVI